MPTRCIALLPERARLPTPHHADAQQRCPAGQRDSRDAANGDIADPRGTLLRESAVAATVAIQAVPPTAIRLPTGDCSGYAIARYLPRAHTTTPPF